MFDVIEVLKKHNLLRVIDDELDIYLEIPHIAYIEVKKSDSKALLFTKPIDKKSGKKFDVPILMNVFGSQKAVELIIGDTKDIASRIDELLKLKPPSGFFDKVAMLNKLFSLKSVFPKRSTKKGLCQEVVKKGDDIKLSDIPVLTTWEEDGGPFITMEQVYTTSLDGTMHNVGMYRLQVYNETQLGMHWQIHKDGNHFFHEYKKAGKKMPVSIGIGGDPLYIWCGQAPLPVGVFELMLYGFIRGRSVDLVKCITNDIYVPNDVDYVIEGFVDPNKIKIEGPFGDHTGYYTLEEEYPLMDVTAITSKKSPIFAATVVGKPPLEDKYMGFATGEIFLPLLKTTAPDLIDYYMPENGVFHNLILAKMNVSYPGHASQLMHAFWGVGQMSFVKHAIFVDAHAPYLTDHEAITKHILNRIDISNILITKGVVDALDHTASEFGKGGKLGIDCTGDEIDELGIILLSDEELLSKVGQISQEVKELKQYYTDTKTPLCIIKVDKKRSQKYLIDELSSLSNHIKVLIIVDNEKNSIDNPYMLLWRVVNNMDSARDVIIKNNFIAIDATNKSILDGFKRRWPGDVECTMSVIEDLQKRGIININDSFIKDFYL